MLWFLDLSRLKHVVLGKPFSILYSITSSRHATFSSIHFPIDRHWSFSNSLLFQTMLLWMTVYPSFYTSFATHISDFLGSNGWNCWVVNYANTHLSRYVQLLWKIYTLAESTLEFLLSPSSTALDIICFVCLFVLATQVCDIA